MSRTGRRRTFFTCLHNQAVQRHPFLLLLMPPTVAAPKRLRRHAVQPFSRLFLLRSAFIFRRIYATRCCAADVHVQRCHHCRRYQAEDRPAAWRSPRHYSGRTASRATPAPFHHVSSVIFAPYSYACRFTTRETSPRSRPQTAPSAPLPPPATPQHMSRPSRPQHLPSFHSAYAIELAS